MYFYNLKKKSCEALHLNTDIQSFITLLVRDILSDGSCHRFAIQIVSASFSERAAPHVICMGELLQDVIALVSVTL